MARGPPGAMGDHATSCLAAGVKAIAPAPPRTHPSPDRPAANETPR
jgi:hypothetical protein